MATAATLIQQTLRRLQPGGQTQVLQVSGSYTAGGSTLTVTDPSGVILPNAQPGQVIAIDLELFLILSVSGSTLGVSPGYFGSSEANHSNATLIYLNPRFSQFDVLSAINDDLQDLCSPENGLYNPQAIEITYNPSQRGYDLAGVTGAGAVISLQQKVPYPVGDWQPFSRKDWTFTPTSDTTDFPSGYALRLNRGGYPGMPIRVTYKAFFSPFVNLADDATTVAGLMDTMYDLPPLGAAVALVAPREVKRNQLDTADDTRRATEVPPGAVMTSVREVQNLRQRRINAENARLGQLYGAQMNR